MPAGELLCPRRPLPEGLFQVEIIHPVYRAERLWRAMILVYFLNSGA